MTVGAVSPPRLTSLPAVLGSEMGGRALPGRCLQAPSSSGFGSVGGNSERLDGALMELNIYSREGTQRAQKPELQGLAASCRLNSDTIGGTITHEVSPVFAYSGPFGKKSLTNKTDVRIMRV